MRLEVVTQLPGSDEHCIEHLLGLGVSGLGISEDFTDEVHRSLYLVGPDYSLARGFVTAPKLNAMVGAC